VKKYKALLRAFFITHEGGIEVGLTPMMQQYLHVKENYKDCILFFRLGDFYEMFFEDAKTASKELELVLTGRDCGLEERAPMCGIPYHAANNYIGRLINKGYKIAICEQLEDPSLAKGIVKRDVIKIYTPGTYTDSSFLEETKNNYIMSLFVSISDNYMGISFADISTGDFTCTYSRLDKGIVIDEISKFNPKEIILQQSIDKEIIDYIQDRFHPLVTYKDDGFFVENAVDNLKMQFKNFEEDLYHKSLHFSVNALSKYIVETQKFALSNIDRLDYYNTSNYVSIDINSRRNLELTETLREKSKKGSLLWVLDKTNTAMGGRELRKWVEQPLVNKNLINYRLNAVEELIEKTPLHQDLMDSLKQIYDIERITGKVSTKSVTAKELLALKHSVAKMPTVKNILSKFDSKLLRNLCDSIDELKDINELLEQSINENPPISVKDGNLIKDGFSETIDELRSAKAHGKDWIASLESKEREVTGIKSLKVGYNKVFGYYIEISNANKSLIPDGRYIRKQTLSNCERFITPELKEMEDKILGSEEKLINIEYELFVSIRDQVELQIDRVKGTARILAELDCLSSLALVALENNFCKPEISEFGDINIKGGKHPVIDKILPTGAFIANDTLLDNKEEQLILITGPNMAGKSTYMRQVALIVIMAQIGSYVPADSAKIAVCDKIFTRIGASDDLSAGKSTFMVEMWEVANILKNATNKSLILLDEVGRGTSTYDGLSIAWSVIEYLCNTEGLKSKTLFATHYHELTRLEGMINGVKNYSVSVKEIGNEIVFLRKIVPGGIDQSYGIEVAKLAGLPQQVIDRAKELLLQLEQTENCSNKDVKIKCEDKEAKLNNKILKNTDNDSVPIMEAAITHSSELVQLNFLDIEKDNLFKELVSTDILNLTPMDGFNKLYELIKKAKTLQ
jgi:DNA mismatch repair protein MutS